MVIFSHCFLKIHTFHVCLFCLLIFFVVVFFLVSNFVHQSFTTVKLLCAAERKLLLIYKPIRPPTAQIRTRLRVNQSQTQILSWSCVFWTWRIRTSRRSGLVLVQLRWMYIKTPQFTSTYCFFCFLLIVPTLLEVCRLDSSTVSGCFPPSSSHLLLTPPLLSYKGTPSYRGSSHREGGRSPAEKDGFQVNYHDKHCTHLSVFNFYTQTYTVNAHIH